MTLDDLHPTIATILMALAEEPEHLNEMLASLPDDADTTRFALTVDNKDVVYIMVEPNGVEELMNEYQEVH